MWDRPGRLISLPVLVCCEYCVDAHHAHGSDTESDSESTTHEQRQGSSGRHKSGTEQKEKTVEDETFLSSNVGGDGGCEDRSSETGILGSRPHSPEAG